MAEQIAIAKDVQVAYGTGSESISYTISKGNKIIYNGKSYKKPSDNYCYFKVNTIVENYLNNREFNPNGDSAQRANNGTGLFRVKVNDVSEYTFNFYCGWDYNLYNIADRQVALLSNPINNKIARNGKLVLSVINTYDSSNNVKIEYYNNGWYSFNVSISANSIVNLIYDVNEEFGNATKVRVLGKEWDIVDDCIEYQLIYLNKRGGYDVVNFNGRTQIEDNFEALNHTKSVLNTSAYHESNKWLNEIKRAYIGNIYWLKREQAERMDNLYSSTMVWLYDIRKDRMVPVVIEDTSIDYQNNKKLMQFQVRVTESQSKQSR